MSTFQTGGVSAAASGAGAAEQRRKHGAFDARAKALATELDGELAAEEGPAHGYDTDGNGYDSVVDLWTKELQRRKAEAWYTEANEYWESEANCPISDDGVLGGYGCISPVDIDGSGELLDALAQIRPSFRRGRAADVGGGIGRVMKGLLLPRFESVELVEQSARLCAAAPAHIGAPAAERATFSCVGMHVWAPPPASVDCIWVQWVIGHLTDTDMIDFLITCKQALREGGVIIFKDNCYFDTDGDNTCFIVDRADSSITRSNAYVKLLVERAGCSVLLERKQANFPDELYPVVMFVIE